MLLCLVCMNASGAPFEGLSAVPWMPGTLAPAEPPCWQLPSVGLVFDPGCPSSTYGGPVQLHIRAWRVGVVPRIGHPQTVRLVGAATECGRGPAAYCIGLAWLTAQRHFAAIAAHGIQPHADSSFLGPEHCFPATRGGTQVLPLRRHACYYLRLGTLATFFPPHSCPSHELRGSVDVKASHTHYTTLGGIINKECGVILSRSAVACGCRM
jgi:hypothetical protein